VRAEQPQAIHEWVNLHTAILHKIMAETDTDGNAAVRRDVARRTLQEWEKVRAGEQEYVNINWYYLKDYKAQVRTVTGSKTQTRDHADPEKPQSKSWWQFWK
jgi:hypothetical protein